MSSIISIFLLYITHKCLVSGSLFNAALYKPAFMSSVFPGSTWTANKANDGLVNVFFVNGQCSHSNSDNPGWWMVDLRGIYRIEQIILVNRGDGSNSASRTQNYQFDIFATDPRLSGGFPMEFGQICYKRIEPVGNGETFIQNCTLPIMGRFVRFIRYTKDALNICEIKVMASYSNYNENNFSLKENSMSQAAPFLTLYTSSPFICTSLCLQRRDSDTCTGVNWVRTTNQCQLLMVDPRSSILQTPNTNTDLYIEF